MDYCVIEMFSCKTVIFGHYLTQRDKMSHSYPQFYCFLQYESLTKHFGAVQINALSVF